MPGHTRSIGGMVKVSEGSKHTAGWPVYAFDTPGIMVPYLGQGDDAGDRAFKMAITGQQFRQPIEMGQIAYSSSHSAGIKETLFDSYDLAAYLFHLLLLRHSSPSVAISSISEALKLPSTFAPSINSALNATQSLPTEQLLSAIANRIKAVEVGGTPNIEAAAQWMLKCFRDGRFGGWTLDDVGQGCIGTNVCSHSEESIISLIESNSNTESVDDNRLVESESVDRSTREIETSISSYFASAARTPAPKSKTAAKMDAKRAKKDALHAQQVLKHVKHPHRHQSRK